MATRTVITGPPMTMRHVSVDYEFDTQEETEAFYNRKKKGEKRLFESTNKQVDVTISADRDAWGQPPPTAYMTSITGTYGSYADYDNTSPFAKACDLLPSTNIDEILNDMRKYNDKKDAKKKTFIERAKDMFMDIASKI